MHILSGSVVRVNLSRRKISKEPTKPYLDLVPGGRGINQLILFRELEPNTGPFEPSNILAFGAGLLTGTYIPGAARLNADSLNALTGGIGSSNAGGNLAAEMRCAGVDNLIVKGKSANPTYLWIHDGEIEIRDATSLWGKGVFDTVDSIKEQLGDLEIQILCIGPAGERLARAACIMLDKNRAFGRCGLGAIMGSKNLKAIAVKGSGSIEVERPSDLALAVRDVNRKLMSVPWVQRRHKYGVYSYNPWVAESPYRNFQGGIVPTPEQTQAVSADTFLRYKTGAKACGACPIACWGIHEVPTASGILKVEALQGNAPHNFGAKLDIYDTGFVAEAHNLCNDLGLDHDNAAGTVAWALECSQRGILTADDTDGLVLRWGDPQLALELFRKLALRDGFGDILAEGSLRASRVMGGTEYSVNVKGQELWESIRTRIGWALGTVVSARGGTHTRGAVQERRLDGFSDDEAESIFGVPTFGSSSDYEGKEQLVMFFEQLQAMHDCLGVCLFTNNGKGSVMPEDLANLLNLATGWNMDTAEFMRTGERVHTLEKCFNVLHRGWTRRHDYPPERFLREPIEAGPAKGQKLDEDKWSALLDRYYDLHGWDRKTSWPTRDTLVELGLSEVADRLQEWNRLP